MFQKIIRQRYITLNHRQQKFRGRCPISAAGLLAFTIYTVIAVSQLISPVQAPAQTDKNRIEETIRDPRQPWRLEADEINYHQSSDEYNAKGNVLIYKENIKLMAEYIRFDHKNMRAYAEGNVRLTDGKDMLRGTSMEIDLENQIGSVENGYLFIKENNYHVTGEVIKKVGEKTYTVDEASLTTCNGERPDWKITGKKVKIKEDGEGTAKHATMWAGNVPVLYTPYFYYPARKRRQTGFLLPEGVYSDRWGVYYNQPFFWAIDESKDATFYGHYMSSRGFKSGMEFRYYADQNSKGALMLDGFYDRKIDDGTAESSKEWGFEDRGEAVFRKNRERYWLRGSHHQKMPWDVNAKLDIDIVSDQDYIRDFENGYTGWKKSKRYFEKAFGRDLDDSNDPIRTSRLSFNKTWPKFSLNAQLRYNQDSTLRNTDDPDKTLQQIPLIEFDAVKQQIANSPFYYDLNSEYVYYWSLEDKRTQRLDAHPRLYLPFQLKPFVTLEPSVGVRETLWLLDKKEFGPENDDQFYHRELYDTRLDLFSEIYKVFHTQGETLSAVKHGIRPRIVHEYIPNVTQDDLPNFDFIDRIEKKNLITYSLTNTLTSKSRKMGTYDVTRRIGKTQAAYIDSPSDYAYHDFLRFKLEQSYDINKAAENDSQQPFSPIFTELDIFPGKYVALDTDALWSVYEWKFLSYNIAAKIWDLRGDELSVEYRLTEDADEIDLNPTQSLYAGLRVKVTDGLAVSADYEYNFLDNTRVETGFGINYTTQCWSFEGRITDKTGVGGSRNLNYEIKFNLFGLGEFGI